MVLEIFIYFDLFLHLCVESLFACSAFEWDLNTAKEVGQPNPFQAIVALTDSFELVG